MHKTTQYKNDTLLIICKQQGGKYKTLRQKSYNGLLENKIKKGMDEELK